MGDRRGPVGDDDDAFTLFQADDDFVGDEGGDVDGDEPCTPVRKRLHGSNCEAYKASASGRTWNMIALMPAPCKELS